MYEILLDGEIVAAFSDLRKAGEFTTKLSRKVTSGKIVWRVSKSHKTHPNPCYHPQNTTATNILAYIDSQGYLSNVERCRNAPDKSAVLDKKAAVKNYAKVTFCSQCEYVSHAIN